MVTSKTKEKMEEKRGKGEESLSIILGRKAQSVPALRYLILPNGLRTVENLSTNSGLKLSRAFLAQPANQSAFYEIPEPTLKLGPCNARTLGLMRFAAGLIM